MRTILALFSSCFTVTLLIGQVDSCGQFLYLGPSNISVGTVLGIHPNLNNLGFGTFVNGEVKQNFRVKGIPLQFTGHLSNESMRIGKPSYFRLSYDPATAQKIEQLKNKNELLSKNQELADKQAELHKMEGKLSYQKELLKRLSHSASLPKIATPELEGFPKNLDSLSSTNPIQLSPSSIQSISSSGAMPDLGAQDSLSEKIEAMTTQLGSLQKGIDSISTDIEQLNKLNLTDYVPDKFKLKKANLGLTSLSSGGLSKNTIPIHGIHVEGMYRRTFYDVSAGLTQPFQNFTSEVFNQITSNTQNVFNLNDFFNTNKMKLVTSEIVGFGEKEKSHLKLEHFYSGKSWESIKTRKSEPISNTINVSGNQSFYKINAGFLIGASAKSRDTVEQSTSLENIAYRGTINYKIDQIKGELESEYRSLGGNYDGVSQGIIINGTKHAMIGYHQKLGRYSSINTRFINDRFSKTDSIVLFNESNRWMTQLNSRFNRQNKFQLSYSLIKGSGNEIKNRTGHLGTAMYINELKIGKNVLTTILQGGYTVIPVRVGYQEIKQASITSDYHSANFTYGLKGSYESYIGIQQLWGVNYIMEPHIRYEGKMGGVSLSYQYLQSEQFNTDHGVNLRIRFSPSAYFTWQFTGQRWLAKERNFFFVQAPSFAAPWYFDFKLIIHLNVEK